MIRANSLGKEFRVGFLFGLSYPGIVGQHHGAACGERRRPWFALLLGWWIVRVG